MIYKIPFGKLGKHIDLSKLVVISDAYFMDHMGSGGYYVGFHMEFQLMERAIIYQRELTIKENPWVLEGNDSYSILMTDGTVYNNIRSDIDESKVQAVVNLQKEVDLIVMAWNDSKK